jgi:acetylornithine deacetylase/succinyl-diaminopimelate desuccinylase-like protein
MPRVNDVLQHLDGDQKQAQKRLCDLLSIPSVSTDPTYSANLRKAAHWIADQLVEMGMNGVVHETAGHPVVMGQSDDIPDAPTVLYYGHYDVQPPDPIDAWTTPPFEPTIRNNAVYARGASDDKGQVCCILEAMRAWQQVHGKLPINVKIIIEGEEEIGSANLPAFIQEHKNELAADVVVISDTTMWDDSTVAITYGLRGLLYFDLKLHGPSRDLHSGMYGGILANPASLITRVLGKLLDDNNHITIAGFYDDVLALTDDERSRWVQLGFDQVQYLGDVGVNTPFGEAGFETLERKWVRPSCDVNGLYGGYMGQGAKTVIPSFAGAKVSFRLAANQDPQKIADQFHAWINSHDVGGCRWEITEHGRANPVIVPIDSPHLAAASCAIEKASGKPPVLVREGATIPIVTDFKSILGIDSLLVGFGLVDDCIHSPNEKFNLDCFRLGCRSHAVMLQQFA